METYRRFAYHDTALLIALQPPYTAFMGNDKGSSCLQSSNPTSLITNELPIIPKRWDIRGSHHNNNWITRIGEMNVI